MTQKTDPDASAAPSTQSDSWTPNESAEANTEVASPPSKPTDAEANTETDSSTTPTESTETTTPNTSTEAEAETEADSSTTPTESTDTTPSASTEAEAETDAKTEADSSTTPTESTDTTPSASTEAEPDTASESARVASTRKRDKRPKHRWRRFVRLMDETESPEALALIRILVPCCLLADWSFVLLYDLEGAVWGGHLRGGFGLADLADPPLLAYRVGGPNVVLGAAIASAITFGLGLFTRASGVVLLASLAQLARLMPQSDRGIDIALRVVICILIFSRCGAIWSLDARYRSGRWYPKLEVAAWPRYLIVLQLLWMYLGAGIHKTQAAWWPSGDWSALYIITLDPHFARFDLAMEPGVMQSVYYRLTQLGTLGTMVFEIGAPLMLLAMWYRRTADRPGRVRRFFNRFRLREAWVSLGVTFHVALMLLMQLGIFPYAMLALYPAFFPPHELRAHGRTLLERRRTR